MILCATVLARAGSPRTNASRPGHFPAMGRQRIYLVHERVCLLCGSVFKTRSGGRQYCGRECGDKAMRHRRGAKPAHEMTPAEVDAYLSRMVANETALPWERA